MFEQLSNQTACGRSMMYLCPFSRVYSETIIILGTQTMDIKGEVQ